MSQAALAVRHPSVRHGARLVGWAVLRSQQPPPLAPRPGVVLAALGSLRISIVLALLAGTVGHSLNRSVALGANRFMANRAGQLVVLTLVPQAAAMALAVVEQLTQLLRPRRQAALELAVL